MTRTARAKAGEHLRAFTSPRRVILLIGGTLGVGIGVGVMICTGLGVGPADAMMSGIADKAGITLGTLLIIASLLMVAVAWMLGTKSGLGTVITFFGIGLVIDATIRLGHDLDSLPLPWRIASWLLGATLLGAGAAALNTSGLGASAYDQLVRSITRFGPTLHTARLIIDALALIGALLLGGALGLGTVALLIIIPLLLKTLIRPMHRWAEDGTELVRAKSEQLEPAGA